MMTRSEARRERQRTKRELGKTDRERYQARQRARKQKQARAKAERRRKLALAKEMCLENARAARDVAAAAYRRGLEALKARRKRTQLDAAAGCKGSKSQIRERADRTIADAKRAAAEERSARAELARIEASNRKRSRARPGVASAVRRSESDDAVVSNIPARLEPLWKRVKSKIKGSDRKSRTEAFLQYAEENPGEVYEAQESGSDAAFAREQEAHWREAERRRA